MARSLSPYKKMSRLRRFAQNHLGVIMTDEMSSNADEFRDKSLDLLDQYYDGTQYDNLMPWGDAQKSDTFVPIRDRKPMVNFNVAKVLVDKVASKLIGDSAFPKFLIDEDEDDTAFFDTVQKAAKFRKSLIDPVKHMLISGAVFVRYYLLNGAIKMEYAKSKYCYPSFDALGELESIEIKYVYLDQQDRDGKNQPKKKWYRLVLTKTADIMYDNPDYRQGSIPTFQEVARADHGLGWVQGEWFVTHTDKFDYDGSGLFADILGFIDELNYSLSQSGQAVSYAQEPQLTLTNIDEDEMDNLLKSSERAWNMGREGKAEFLESNLEGVSKAQESRDHSMKLMLAVVRVVIHDPEKFSGNAQSGEALKQLYAPMLELIDELRAVIEGNMTNLLIKIALTCLHFNELGEQTVIETPPGYLPTSFDFNIQWPNLFPPTLADISMMANAANVLSTAQIVSRETLTKWIASQTPIVDNVEEEMKRLAAQPPIPSPFGDFGG